MINDLFHYLYLAFSEQSSRLCLQPADIGKRAVPLKFSSVEQVFVFGLTHVEPCGKKCETHICDNDSAENYLRTFNEKK